MHAILLTITLLVGAGQQDIFSDQGPVIGPQPPAVGFHHMIMGNGEQPCSMPMATAGVASDVPGPYHYDPPRDPQEADGLIRGFFTYCCAWFHPMPQTCYSPHYGCYPGNGRDIYRYPAFHGYYYRQAYNYRPLFEYPWQAGMHEPFPWELDAQRSLAGNPQCLQPVPLEVIGAPPPTPLPQAR